MRLSLSDWQNNGWIRPHRSSRNEIAGLLSIVDRDLVDANTDDLSSDWKFGIAYNASLKLCTILLHASGFRPEKNLQHFRTIAALPEIMGSDKSEVSSYLEACRVKRNTVEYDTAGATSDAEARELLHFAIEFRIEVLDWLRENHPDFIK
jgi:hypothetical protein